FLGLGISRIIQFFVARYALALVTIFRVGPIVDIRDYAGTGCTLGVPRRIRVLNGVKSLRKMLHTLVEIIKARIVDEVVPLGLVVNAFSHAGPGPEEMVPNVLLGLPVRFQWSRIPIAPHVMSHLAILFQPLADFRDITTVKVFLLHPAGQFTKQTNQTFLLTCGSALVQIFEILVHLFLGRRKTRSAE